MGHPVIIVPTPSSVRSSMSNEWFCLPSIIWAACTPWAMHLTQQSTLQISARLSIEMQSCPYRCVTWTTKHCLPAYFEGLLRRIIWIQASQYERSIPSLRTIQSANCKAGNSNADIMQPRSTTTNSSTALKLKDRWPISNWQSDLLEQLQGYCRHDT